MFDRSRKVIHGFCDRIVVDDFRSSLQKKRNFAVSNRLLRQVIIDNKCWSSSVTEELTYRCTRKRSKELHWSRIRSRCCNDYSVWHCASFLQRCSNVCYSRVLLTNSHI